MACDNGSLRRSYCDGNSEKEKYELKRYVFDFFTDKTYNSYYENIQTADAGDAIFT